MIALRPGSQRGHFNHGWLDTFHSFSFGDYHDPAHMGFATLRVINEDRVAAAQGFPTHPHKDMEIITYVLSGALEHRDSLGTSSVIRPGEVQRMSAGRGVTHSEFNASRTQQVHLLQIWIRPQERGLEPSYEQKSFPAEAAPRNRLQLLASPDGAEGSVTIHQDARLLRAVVKPGDSIRHELAPRRQVWVQAVRGEARLNGQILKAGDGAAVTDERALSIEPITEAELLVFDLKE